MNDYAALVHRLRTEWDDVEIDCEAADAIEAQTKRIEDLESHINASKRALEPFAKELAWKFGKYVGELPIIAKSTHTEVEDEMIFCLDHFRFAHRIWERLGNDRLEDK